MHVNVKISFRDYNHECKSIDTIIILLMIRRFRQKMDVSAKIYLIVSQIRILFVGGFTESPLDMLALLQPTRSREDNNESNGYRKMKQRKTKIKVGEIIHIYYTSKIPVRWPGQCYGFTLSLIFKYCGGI